MKKLLTILTILVSSNAEFTAQEIKTTSVIDTVNVSYSTLYDNFESIEDTFYHVIGPNHLKEHWKVYYSSNHERLLLDNLCKNDTCTSTQYFYNGKIKRKVVEALHHGLVYEEVWCANGQLIRKVKFQNGPTHIINYYCNGNKKIDFTLDRIFSIGKWRGWYDNGQIRIEGTYVEKNKKDGLWKYYSREGKLTKEEEWDHGKLIDTINLIDSLDLDSDVLNASEIMPEFPGGLQGMFKFLGENIIYPKDAKKKNIEGKVYVNFVVGKDGMIRDINVIKGVHPLLDKEAMRVVSLMPKWSAGIEKGRKVSVSFNLPINFVLNEGKGSRSKQINLDNIDSKIDSLTIEFEKAVESDKFALSEQILNKITALEVEIYFFLLNQSEDYFKQEKWGDAMDYLDEAIIHYATHTMPSTKEFFTKRNLILKIILRKLTNLIAIKPSSNAYSLRALVREDFKEYDLSISDFTKALELDSSDYSIYFNRGILYDIIGNHKDAIEDFSMAIEADSLYESAYGNRGYAKMQLGHYLSAIEDFEKSIRLNDVHLEIGFMINNIGYCHYKMKDYELATTYVLKSIKILPTNSFAYKNLALICIALGKNEEACKSIKKSIELGFVESYGNEILDLEKNYCN